MNNVTLLINGQKHEGWENVSIRRSIEQLCNSFNLQLSERWPGQKGPWVIRPGDRCQVLIGNQTLITGYIDQTNPSFSTGGKRISVSGRDITEDCLDVSARLPNQEINNVHIRRAAEQLLGLLGLSVQCPDPGKPFEKVSVNPGESIFNCLQRYAKLRRLLLFTDADGILNIAKAGNTLLGVELAEGDNIKAASATHNHAGRYHHYQVIGQALNLGKWVESDYTPRGLAKDSDIRQGREILIRAESAANTEDCTHRAILEKAIRKGRSLRATITVQGWEYQPNKIWPVNALVKVNSPTLRLGTDPLLIVSADYKKDESGTETTLELANPDAYQLNEP